MNNSITPELIMQAGVNLPAEQIEALVERLNTELEDRVGEAIVNVLDDDKLDELAKLQGESSDEEIAAWLESNVEDLPGIVEDEIDILIGEVSENTDAFGQA